MKIFINQHCHPDCPCRKEVNQYEEDLKALNDAFDQTIAEVEKQRAKAKGMLRVQYCRMGREDQVVIAESKDEKYPSDHPFNTCWHNYKNTLAGWETCIKCGNSQKKNDNFHA